MFFFPPVIEAANGWKAWKILEDLTNHIDLVLTEVAMRGLSGIGLLHKIMSHKTRKNIPVISKFSQVPVLFIYMFGLLHFFFSSHDVKELPFSMASNWIGLQ